jgi:hypothetical protein
LRPLARRRLRIARPPRVDIRARNPCRRFRRRTFGWKVRFKRGARRRCVGCGPALAGHRASIEKPASRLVTQPSLAEAPETRGSRVRSRPSDQSRKIWAHGNPQAENRMATGLTPPFHSCGDCCGKEELACSGPVFGASARMFSSVEGPRRRCYDRRFPESGGGSNKPACNALLN